MIVRSCWFAISYLVIGALISPVSSQPDTEYFTIQPKDEAIARIYAGLLDRDINTALQSFNPDSGLVQVQIPGSVKAGHLEIRTMSDAERSSLATEPEYNWRYLQIQQTTNLAGGMGYAYSLKQSQFYQSPETLQHLRSIFHAFAESQLENGEFAFSSIRYGSVWGTHVLAYQLEALMNAYVMVRSDFPEGERATYQTMLNKGVEFLFQNEPGFDDSRGMVWCGVMASAGRFTGKNQYLNAASQKLKSIQSIIFQEDGQVLENGAPDFKYSLISMQYLFLYQQMSGDRSLNTVVVNSLRWISQLYSFHAVPLSGSITKGSQQDGKPLANLMGALTYYGTEHSDLNQTATTYLEGMILMKEGGTLQYGSGHFLRGSQYHTKPGQLNEIPYESYANLHSTENSLYYTIGRNYQTFITLQHPTLLKGMQIWTYKGQKPLVFPSPIAPSQVLGFGVDSSKLGVNKANTSDYKLTPLSVGLETLIYKQNSLVSGFVFSNDITVVLYRDENENGWVDWVMAKPHAAQMSTIENHAVMYEDTDARIFLPPVEPALIDEETHTVLRFPYKAGMTWFSFTGPKSIAIVQPVIEGIVLIQLNNEGEKVNLAVNMAAQSFQVDMNFPGTNIPVPNLAPFEAALIPS